MRFNLNLLVAFLPLIAGSPLNLYESSKRANDTSGVSVSLEDTITAPATSAASFEDYELHQRRAAKNTCPAKSKGAKSAKSKAGRWLSGLIRRNGDYGSLSVPTTANPLDEWATQIYKTENKEVHIDFDTDSDLKPTSLFQKFGDSDLYMTLTGLYGCTGVVVTSYCGAYMAHFWQSTMSEEVYNGNKAKKISANKDVFLAAVADPLKGIRNKAAEEDANKKIQWPQALAPDADFVSLSAHKDCLHKNMGAKAFVFTPADNNDATVLESPSTVAALREVLAGITGLSLDDVVTYKYKTPGETKAKAKTNGEGKVLLTYSPNTGAATSDHAYQVHVKKLDNPDVTMAVGDTWTGDSSQCECGAKPMLVKKHDPGCCPCS